MMGDDHLAPLEKLVGRADAFIQQASGVAAKIQDHSFQVAKLLQRVFHFLLGGLIEGADMHVADAGPDHELQIHAVPRYLIAHHVELQRLVAAFAQDGDMNVSAPRSLEHIGYRSHAQVVRGLAVDSDDRVTGAQADLVRRRTHEGGDHDDLVVARRDLDAHAVILSALFFAQQRVRLRIEEVRMRIQYVQHSRDGAVIDRLIGIDRLGVILLYQTVNFRKLLQAGADIAIGDSRAGTG